MTDAELTDLARAAGVAVRWRNVRGEDNDVAPPTLRAVLAALGLPDDAADARAALTAVAERLPRLVTLPCGSDGAALPGATIGERYRLDLENGGHVEGTIEQGLGGEARLPALDQPGYHRLHLSGGQVTVAAAPPRCVGLADIGAARHAGGLPWALAAQIPSLRRAGDGGIGDFGSVAALAAAAARRGAAGIAVSPAHALFAADPHRYGPYAPSSRIALNVLLADPAAALGPQQSGPDPYDALIDWPTAGARKLARLRTLFQQHADHPDFVAFRSEAGPAIEDHARFEALHAWRYGEDPAQWNWRDWPADYATPDAPGVARFGREHPERVAFHAFCQWLADASRGAAQAAARDAGMPIGLIADLAVGTDGGGSHAWSRQAELLPGVSMGAPPDIFSPLGQDWGLTAFSPLGLRLSGFGAFLELLHAAFRHAGGVRIDHAMGLERLWVVPAGAGPAEGAYLHYPVDDLFRLVALESHRHRAIVIGEDLGTLPEGFHGRMDRAGVLGMRVLWFEQAGDAFRPPRDFSRDAAVLTSTHDLPTIAGWWAGRDIAWRERLGRFPSAEVAAAERTQRDADRAALWRAMLESGAAEGDSPPPDGDATPVVDAAVTHAAGAASALLILPLEDALGLDEQPNLPGTVEDAPGAHPNWRRRLPGDAATLLGAPAVARRLTAVQHARIRAATGA